MIKKVYVIQDGYEGDRIIAVFDKEDKAKKHLREWKEKIQKRIRRRRLC